MAYRRRQQQPFRQSRKKLIAEAEILFAQAKHYVAEASVYATRHWFWMRAASTFEEAAGLYREAGLGGMARILYGYASDCFTTDGKPEHASRCKALAEAVPVCWEADK